MPQLDLERAGTSPGSDITIGAGNPTALTRGIPCMHRGGAVRPIWRPQAAPVCSIVSPLIDTRRPSSTPRYRWTGHLIVGPAAPRGRGCHNCPSGFSDGGGRRAAFRAAFHLTDRQVGDIVQS